MNLQPKTTFNSITNRTKFILESVSAIETGGNYGAMFQLVLGQAITGVTTLAAHSILSLRAPKESLP